MPHTTSDNRGLICAFQLEPLAACGHEVLDAGVDRAAAAPGGATWLHFNLSDARARLWLSACKELPDDARALLLDSDQHTHIEIVPPGVAAVLSDLDHELHRGQQGFGALRVYLDESRIISGRRHPLKAVDLLRRQVQAGLAEIPTPLAVLQNFIECLATTVGAMVSRLGGEVDDAEEEILAGTGQWARGQRLGSLRRSLARLRRLISGNRSALLPLPRRLPAWATAAQREGLRQAIERLDAAAQDLELVQERARLLQEEIEGRLTEATNRNLFLLSIVTTTLLPITLITGVFGMNVGGLPWVNRPSGFWWVLLVMGIAVIATLIFLRRRRVL